MGTFAAEMCAPYCLPLVLNSLNGSEAEWAYILVKEFIRCLTAQAVKTLILPTIQKILQVSCEFILQFRRDLIFPFIYFDFLPRHLFADHR